MEGILAANDLDLMSIRGGNISHIITVSAFITDGNVTIDLVRVKDNPQINGIEVYDDGQPIPLPTAIPQTILQPTLAPFSSMPLNSSFANSSMTPVTSPVNLTSNTTSNTSGALFQDVVINCGGAYAINNQNEYR